MGERQPRTAFISPLGKHNLGSLAKDLNIDKIVL